MFLKLQKKILLLNMTLISVVMLLAFAAVYLTTWHNARRENLRRMDNQALFSISYSFEMTDNPARPADMEIEGTPPFDRIESNASSMFLQVSPDYSLSFSVEIDDDGKVVATHSIMDLPPESYRQAAQKAIDGGRDDGTISLEGKEWLYRVELLPAGPGLDRDPIATQGNRQILFLDVSESSQTLRNLLATLSIIGVPVLAVFYCISLYFSKRAVKPVIAAWERQERFIADASHELKTPLTIIGTNCDALRESEREPPENRRKWIDRIQAGADRMACLTAQLLTLARMDGAVPAADKETDLSALALDGIRLVQAMADRRGLTVVQAVEPGVVLKSDGDKIATVFTVLLENAVKYADSRVDVALKKEKRRAYFIVKNDGRGIGKEDLPRVFDRFFRGDASRVGDGGYGLGLSIAKTVAESLGGSIEAESEENVCTVFTAIFDG